MNACRFSPNFAVWITTCLFAVGAFAQETIEVKLPRGLTEVVKLVGSGVGEDVVISYIQTSSLPRPTADDLIELHRAKVPSTVIVALLSKQQRPVAEPAPVAKAAPPASTPNPPQVISAPAPATVYVQRPVYVQPEQVVVYPPPYYHRGYDWAAFGIDLGLHHIFGHHGHHGHFGHHGFGHHGGLHVFGGHHGHH